MSRHFTENNKCALHGAIREKVKGVPKSQGFILWGPGICVLSYIAIHPRQIISLKKHKCQTNSDPEEDPPMQTKLPLGTVNVWTRSFIAINPILDDIS